MQEPYVESKGETLDPIRYSDYQLQWKVGFAALTMM